MRRAARGARAVGVILAAAVALLFVGVGTASALQVDPPPGGGSQHAVGSVTPSIELIPAVSATIIAPAPGVAIELIPATSATLASTPVGTETGARAGSHVLPAAVHVRQKPAAAGDSDAAALATTTISEGSVSIELIPATSSEIAPTPAPAPADSTAAQPAADHASRANGSGAAVQTTAAQTTAPATTGAESVSVLAEAGSVSPAAAIGHAGPSRALGWILAAAVAVLLGGAAVIIAHTRRPVRH